LQKYIDEFKASKEAEKKAKEGDMEEDKDDYD
jgi:hypothetical protein